MEQKVAPAIHLPLIQSSNGNFTFAEKFLRIWHDVKILNDISYKIIEDTNNPHNQQTIPHWDNLKVFHGTSGNVYIAGGFFDDVPGLIRYNRTENIIAIIFHGSSNCADWLTNFICTPRKAQEIGLNFEGTYHKGFLCKYKDCKENLEYALSSIMDALPIDVQSQLQFIVSGHSQGAALAHIASIDLTQNFLKTRFSNFENKNNNKLYGFYLAYLPWREDNITRTFCETTIGGNNILWHTVEYDPVSRAGIGSHFKGPGHLGIEYFSEVIKKDIKNTSTTDLFDHAIKYPAGAVIMTFAAFTAPLWLIPAGLVAAKSLLRLHSPIHLRGESCNFALLNNPEDALAKSCTWQKYCYQPDARELHEAAWQSNYIKVKELLKKVSPTCYIGHEKNFPTPTHFITPLHIAAYKNDPKLIEILLEGKTPEELYKEKTILYAYDSADLTPFHSAAYDGNAEVLKCLLNYNRCGRFFVNQAGNKTPMYYAAKNGHFEAVQVLCDISNELQHYSPGDIKTLKNIMGDALSEACCKIKCLEGDLNYMAETNKEEIEKYKRICDYLMQATGEATHNDCIIS